MKITLGAFLSAAKEGREPTRRERIGMQFRIEQDNDYAQPSGQYLIIQTESGPVFLHPRALCVGAALCRDSIEIIAA